MYCSSCGKKITENSKFCKYCGASQTEINDKEKKNPIKDKYETVWTCDYCGEEFKTKKESDSHELSCLKNPNRRKSFFKNKSQRAWFYLWIVTLLVFVVSLLINAKFDDYGINLFNSEFLSGLFFFNILVGINTFIATVVTSIKKNNKVSFIASNIFIISLVYFFLNISVFAVEGFKAKNDEGYKNKYYVEITPTPLPTAEPTVTPKVIPKKTIKPVQKVVDTDPIVNCTMSAECGGDIRKVKESECKNGTCCQIGSSWIFYTSKQKCIDDQNKARPNTVNNPQIVPTTAVYVPYESHAGKVAVFLSYNNSTTYCPPQNVEAVKSIVSSIESKKSGWDSKYNECVSSFKNTDGCWVNCKNISTNEVATCVYGTSDYSPCIDRIAQSFIACNNSCTNPDKQCQFAYSERSNLISQITNLCN